MLVHRVIPYLADAEPDQPGGPRYVPAVQGAGRVDNPDHYRVLYLADDPAGAVGEALASFHTWTPALLTGPPALTGSRLALVTYETDATIVDLDDPHQLAARDLRPSRVVTRDRATTQGWARELWSERRWQGVRWWSRWHPEWGALGLWAHDVLRVLEIVTLHAEHSALTEAAAVLNRPWTARG